MMCKSMSLDERQEMEQGVQHQLVLYYEHEHVPD